jgi:hypothetical protein
MIPSPYLRSGAFPFSVRPFQPDFGVNLNPTVYTKIQNPDPLKLLQNLPIKKMF